MASQGTLLLFRNLWSALGMQMKSQPRNLRHQESSLFYLIVNSVSVAWLFASQWHVCGFDDGVPTFAQYV